MELGEKLRQARLEAGLTQRQLCGEEITRNMLSLIENGSASPSMKTLQYLAAKLGKPTAFFLEEDAVLSPNQQYMFCARDFFDEENYAEALKALEPYQQPDPLFDREYQLLKAVSLLNLAEQSIARNRTLYALELLEKADCNTFCLSRELERRRLLLIGRLNERRVSELLPSLDEELLLRAREALASGDWDRAGKLLDAAQNQSDPYWQLLRGESYLEQQDYHQAKTCLLAAETAFPKETLPKLELCFRELGDFRQAYEYACKQR